MPSPAPIAIIGMSCRLSGDVSNLDEFWTLVSRSRDGWSPIPEDRFSKDIYLHPNPQKRGCYNQKGGYYMRRDLSKFDAPFFQITEQEALAMDPQQRQLLECTYEALENAGLPKESLAGKPMGVFIGGTGSDYRISALRDLDQVPVFEATGNHPSIQAGRLSYYFNLSGPCLTVDTACSSSLHALHLAVQSIRSGESDSAIVAGCSLHLQPDDTVAMSMLGILNDEGRTYAFDHRAKSGFARGEGVGCLILKPLDQALRDNDKIRSVIVNTGIGQDGKTTGLTTPSSAAQEKLMRDVYARAGISPEQTGFVEAHGTGTKVGDPLEAGAIYRVFGSGRSKRFPLYMGSSKTNFGHLENASGIISIIKASLILEKGFILPNVNFEKANEEIPLDKWNMKVPTSIRPWPSNKRFISINNFGFGGSNAHVVMEHPPLPLSDLPKPSNSLAPKLFVLCANDEQAAKRIVGQIGNYIEQRPDVFEVHLPRDIAYTLGERRTHLPWRIAITANTCDDFAKALNGPAAIPKRTTSVPKLAFVYTGQGAQWPQMGLELMETHPVFASTLRSAAEHLKRLGADFCLMHELSKAKDESNIGKAHISQPASTAVQLALTALLASWGIKPSMTVGHSSGEIVSAFAAGAISLGDAMAIAYHRGRVTSSIKQNHPEVRGAMLAVGAGPTEVKKSIKLLGLDNITVACENSPSSVTVSGDESAINVLARQLESQNLFVRKLRVEVAYHSSHMKLVADEYLESIQHIRSNPPDSSVSFFSSLLGGHAEGPSLGPSYWVDNLTHPVRFSTALHELCAEGRPDIVIEVGPHSALEGPIKQILKGIKGTGQQTASKVKYFSCLLRNRHATETAVNLAASLFTQGYPLNFTAINHPETNTLKPSVITDFQPYPWSEHRFWNESRISKQHRIRPFARHDLLGTLVDSYRDDEPTWRNILTTDDVPWLKDHRMQSLITFPLAGFLCMALEAACQRAQLQGLSKHQMTGFRLREVQITKALILEDGKQYETMVSLRSNPEGTRSYSTEWDEFHVSSYAPGRGWLEHCRGLIQVKKQTAANPISNLKQINAESRRRHAKGLSQSVSIPKFYAELEARGAGYGSIFTLDPDSGLKADNEYATSKVTVPKTACFMPASHETPSILGAAFTDLLMQPCFSIIGAGRGELATLYMPSAIHTIDITGIEPRQPGEEVEVFTSGNPDPEKFGPIDFFVDVWKPTELQPTIRFEGLRITPVNGEFAEAQAPRSLCYQLKWQPLFQDIQSNHETHGAPNNANNGVLMNNNHSHANDQSPGEPQPVKIGKYSNGNAKKNGHSRTSSINGHNGHCRNLSASDQNGHSRTQSTNGRNGHSRTQSTNDKKANSSMGNILNSDVTIVTDKSASDPSIATLARLLSLHSGNEATVCSLSSLVPSPSTRYIFFAETHSPVLLDMKEETFKRVQDLLLTCSSILWVELGAYHFAERPFNNIAQGLIRTLRSETGKTAAILDLDSNSKLHEVDRANLVIDALKASLTTNDDGLTVYSEFSEDDGQLVVPQVVEQEQLNLELFRQTQSSLPYLQDFNQPGRRLKIAVGTYGALDSLYWKDDDKADLPLADEEIEIKIAATGMNFKDVVISMGQVPSPYLGVECSGTVSRVGSQVRSLKIGDRVCAMSVGAYGTYTRCPATSAALIPADMDFEIAASVPVVYCTAYYGIMDLARMEPGEKILIHAASGGVGQAAIQLAQLLDADIYATVGSADKKKLLMDTYSIPEDRIFYSRNTDFGPAIRTATHGRGVDVVLNSLANDFLRESWASLAPFGRFIEIGKKDILANTRLEMAKFEQNCTFSSVDLALVASERPKVVGRVFSAVMDLLRKRNIRPIGPISTVGISEVTSALRKLQSGKTTGKMIVSHLIPDQQVKVTHPKISTTVIVGDATYIIVGGTGGIGRSMAARMVQRGARHLVLLSRKAIMTTELEKLIRESQELGAFINIKQCDVSDEAQVENLVQYIEKSMPPIRGIIHAAMVLKDVLFEKMKFEDWDMVVRSKIQGAWNFHTALAGKPLDFFIVLSSVAGIIGNRGQAAYAGANTFLDALVAHRRRKGLKGTSLNLAAIEGVGYLAEAGTRRTEVLKNVAGSTLGEDELLALVEAAMNGQVDRTCDGQCITGLDFSNSSSMPYYASEGKFSTLRSEALAKELPEACSSGSSDVAISQKLRGVETPQQAQDEVAAALLNKLGSILMLAAEDMAAQQATTSITAFGLDSLTAIELRNWIGKELQAHLQVLELLTSGLVHDLAGLILRKTRLVGVWSK